MPSDTLHHAYKRLVNSHDLPRVASNFLTQHSSTSASTLPSSPKDSPQILEIQTIWPYLRIWLLLFPGCQYFALIIQFFFLLSYSSNFSYCIVRFFQLPLSHITDYTQRTCPTLLSILFKNDPLHMLPAKAWHRPPSFLFFSFYRTQNGTGEKCPNPSHSGWNEE